VVAAAAAAREEAGTAIATAEMEPVARQHWKLPLARLDACSRSQCR